MKTATRLTASTSGVQGRVLTDEYRLFQGLCYGRQKGGVPPEWLKELRDAHVELHWVVGRL